MLWGGWGERKRKREERWEGGRERRDSCLYPLPVVPHALSMFFFFFGYCYVYRDTQRELLLRRESPRSRIIMRFWETAPVS